MHLDSSRWQVLVFAVMCACYLQEASLDTIFMLIGEIDENHTRMPAIELDCDRKL